MADAEQALEQLRSICAALPEVTERRSHGAPSFFVRGSKTLLNLWDDHHGDGMLAIWVAAPPGAQEELVALEPDRFFRPPYVGHRGWLGVRLDHDAVDFDEVAAIVRDGYRQVAPKRLVARLDADAPERVDSATPTTPQNEEPAMADPIELWHNPRCSKSRQAKALLVEQGLDHVERRYLEDPPSMAALDRVLKAMGVDPWDFARTKETKDAGVDVDALGRNRKAWLKALVEHPKMIERPVVIRGDQAAIGRPTEAILDIL